MSIAAYIEPHIWWILALICSWATSGFVLCGQYFSSLPALSKTFWRGLVPLLALTPLLFFIELPQTPLFYFATITTSFIVTYSDTRTFAAAEKFGAGVTSRMKPFSIWLIFILWFALSPTIRAPLLAAPIQLAGISAMLIIGAVSASLMKSCAVSRRAIIYCLPLIICGTAVDSLNKVAMDASPLLGGVIMYSWIQAAIITVLTLGTHIAHKDFCYKALFKPSAIKAGLVIGLSLIIASLAKNTAMSYTHNPSYVTAIIFTSPFWISLYYRVVKHQDKGNMWAGYGLVLSTIGLIIIAL